MRDRLLPALTALLVLHAPAIAQDVRTGTSAFGDWRTDGPGVARRITTADLPPPYATASASQSPSVIRRPSGATLHVPQGFRVDLFAGGFDTPRTLRTAPNGDIFLAESGGGTVRVLRAKNGAAKPDQTTVFAKNLSQPYGIAFWPPGPDPRFVYVAETGRVVRFPYQNGDLIARGPAQVIIPNLPTGGHWTRDIVFSPDGARLYLAVGSETNMASSMRTPLAPATLASWEEQHGVGAAWGDEAGRANVLVYDPEGHGAASYARGLRNCSGLALQPATGLPVCVVNERDGLGDNLVPDYLTRVRQNTFYGWPWFYLGAHEDPRFAGARRDLVGHVVVPDVLIQPHSAPLGVMFHDGVMFGANYRGDAFVTLHGSWNRSMRTGYKVIRVRFDQGNPTGVYEDFLTGFVRDDDTVWGRPVGVTEARDGALLVSEDGNGTIWRIAR